MASKGSSAITVHGLIIAAASLVDHGLWGTWVSAVVAPGLWTTWSVLAAHGLRAPWHVGSSRPRDQIHVPAIGRRILHH